MENWYIKVASNRNHIVIKYLNEKYSKSHDGSAAYYGVINGNTDFAGNGKYFSSEGCKEITLEFFIEVFLKNKLIKNNYYFY